MRIGCHLIRTLCVLLIAAFGTVASFAAPGDSTRISYPVEAQELFAQPINLTNAARAPPHTSANVMATGAAFAQTGILRAFDGAETTGVIYALLRSSSATNRTALIDDLQASGAKITPENVVDIQKLPDGRTVWLETGNNSAGLQHINRHADEFAQKGISQDQIPDAVFSALQQNNVVGYQGAGTGRPIYEYTFNGQTHRMAVTVGDNGFIVGANPTSLP